MNIEKYLTRTVMLVECGYSITEAVEKVKKAYEKDEKTESENWINEVLKK